MTFRATRITVENETGWALRLRSKELDGEWTEKWAPPETIGSHSTGGFRSENKYAFQGTAGKVVYAVLNAEGVDTGGEVEIHWKNPAIGVAFYEQRCPDSMGIYFEGGKGDDARATYHLIAAQRFAVPGFKPSHHGFQFSNSFPKAPVVELDTPFGTIAVSNASQGLCGGMASGAIDYFLVGLWSALDASTAPGDELFETILRRQKALMVFDPDMQPPVPSGLTSRIIEMMNPQYPDTDDMFLGDGRNWVTAHQEWPNIRRHIDGGRPALVTLVFTLDDAEAGHAGHQVAAYAYQLVGNSLTLWVYDPNTPASEIPGTDTVTISVDMARTDQQLFNYQSKVDVPGVTITCLLDSPYQQQPAVKGRLPIPEFKLSVAVEAGTAGPIGTHREQIDDGCTRGVYHHILEGTSQRVVITPLSQGVDPGSLTWTVAGQALPSEGYARSITGLTGAVIKQTGIEQWGLVTGQPIDGVTATATPLRLIIYIPGTAGDFDMVVEATDVNPAAKAAKAMVSVKTTSQRFDPALGDALQRCIGPLLVEPINIRPVPSDGPWDDIFGAGGPWEASPVALDPAATRAYWCGRRDAILGAIAQAEATEARNALAKQIARLYPA